MSITINQRGAIALQQLRLEPDTGDTVRCYADLLVDDQALHLESTASGAIGALSELLHGLDAGVEIVTFYQQHDGERIAVYLLCARKGERCWAYGRATTGDEAVARALISAANQLR